MQTIDGAEVIAFHWHPNGRGDADAVSTPHTHIGSTQLNPAGVISKKHHIPGRRMSVEEVLRYCITEIGVDTERATASIDRGVVDQLTSTMGGAFVGELIDTFIENGRELVATLQRALADTDVDTFRRAAHSLKSNAETLGAAALATVARALEAMARAGSLDGAAEPLRQLAAHYETAARELEEIRSDLPA